MPWLSGIPGQKVKIPGISSLMLYLVNLVNGIPYKLVDIS